MNKVIFFVVLFCADVVSSVVASDTLSGINTQNAGECCGSSYHLYSTIRPVKRYLGHLDRFRMWLCSNGKQCRDIDSAIIQRYNLFLDTCRHRLKTDGFQRYGDHKAAIQIVMYMSMTCPLCKRLYNELIDSLSVKKARKNIAITAVPFTSNEADRFYSAMFRWGKQVELLRALQPVKERVTPELILTIADSLGIKKDELLNYAHSQEITALVTGSRDCGIAAGVRLTPTFFVNGVRYSSYKDIRWIFDYIDVIMAEQ